MAPTKRVSSFVPNDGFEEPRKSSRMGCMKSARRWGTLAAVFAMTIACGSESGGGGAGTSSGSSGTSGSSGGFGGGGGGDGGPGTSSGNPGNCFAPVDMFIMFDRSGSMARDRGNGRGDPALDCNIGQNVASKWCRSINALSGYFKSSGSDKQAAALQFFPHDNHTSAQCTTGEAYHVGAKPTADYQTLPSDVFDADLNAQKPDTRDGTPGTPTEGAIRGLTRFTAANRRPGRVTIGILITDGDPTNINDFQCNTDLPALSNLLKAHHDATQVRTYVIGMEGASDGNLERIAEGGGAPLHPNDVPGIAGSCGNNVQQCRHWNVGDGAPAAFVAALAAIQESANGCKEGGGFVNPVN
jgi:hypothetical protein